MLISLPSAAPAIMHWSTLAASSLLSASWEGLVLAAAVGLCLRLLPGMSPAVRSLVWTMVFAVLVLLHFGAARHAGAPLLTSGSEHSLAHGWSRNWSSNWSRHCSLEIDPRWSLAAAGLWAVAGVVRAVRLAASAVRLRGIARRATPVDGVDETGPGKGRSPRLFRRAAVLCTSADVDRPCVLGFLRPRILVPESLFAELSAPDLEQVVLHEMEHLRRGDDWTNLVQKLALVAFPLNPVLVWVERRLCLERELACDDGVLRSTGAPKAYATCLARLAEHAMMLREASSLALGALGAALERRSELVRRVHRILADSQPRTMSRSQAAAVTMVLVAGLLGGAAWLEHAPELVRFAPANMVAAAKVDASVALPESGLQRGAQARPVVDRVRSGRRPQLISAVMTSRALPGDWSVAVKNGSAEARKPKVPRAVAAKAVVTRVRPRVMQQASQAAIASQVRPGLPAGVQPGSFVVLTRWQETEPAPAMLVALPEQVSHTYAAVRVADGWLIVSL